MASQPICLPEGEWDYSCPHSNHAMFALEDDDVHRMRSTSTTPDTHLSDAGVRAMLINTLKGPNLRDGVALFDPAWMTNWSELSLEERRTQMWTALPKPLATCGTVRHIVIPVCSMMHWMAFVFDIAEQKLVIYDSMSSQAYTNKLLRCADLFGEVFQTFLCPPGEDLQKYYKVRHAGIVQQKDAVSCGVHAILNCQLLLQDLGLPEQFHPSYGTPLDVAHLRREYGNILQGMMWS